MKFGRISLRDAEGAILAHAQRAGSLRLKKGVILTKADVAALKAAGIDSVVAAQLDDDDTTEDLAASKLAAALLTKAVSARSPATGRVNLHASDSGVFRVNRELVDRINTIDPAITLATLADCKTVAAGQMVATIKIIPFAVKTELLQAVCEQAGSAQALAVAGFHARKIGLVQTELPSVKESVLAKTRRMTEMRLARSQSRVVEEIRTPHDATDVAAAIGSLLGTCDMIVAFGASAMTDFDDVIPRAIRDLGGSVERVGMPVDPGNLLVLGWIDGKPVLGAPGCARSPKENGFDWVLDRLMADIPVTAADIAGMGVGGLLTEIASRTQPREQAAPAGAANVHAAILAAGRSSRMGGPNKLLSLFEGVPLVRRMALRALGSRASGVTLVCGHQRDRVMAAVSDLEIRTCYNADFASGLASSLQAAVMDVPRDADGLMVILGDMPTLAVADFDRLISGFRKSGGGAIVRATHNGKRGNPVILPRTVFAEVLQLEGDTGARHLVEHSSVPIIDIEIGASASLDVDTPDAVMRAGGVLLDE